MNTSDRVVVEVIRTVDCVLLLLYILVILHSIVFVDVIYFSVSDIHYIQCVHLFASISYVRY